MKKFDYIITDELGIHARPAGMLVKEAAKYEADVTLECNGKSGDAKRIFTVMGMGIKQKDSVTVSISGVDEEKAASALEDFFKTNL